MPQGAAEPLVEIEDLSIEVRTPAGAAPAVLDVSLRLFPGRVLALVGESGSGKSLTALAIMRLLPRAARVTGGSGVAKSASSTSTPAPVIRLSRLDLPELV